MIYQKQLLQETTATAIGIFVVVLLILVFTQAINLLGRAVDGRVAIDAVLALIGFWTLGMTPLLLVLTAYISILSVLTRWWRDSEMSVWLASGLSLKQWVVPVWQFATPLAIVVALMQLWVLPWAELRSREYAEILKQKQNLSLVEQGTFRELNKKNGLVYFVEEFDTVNGKMRHLFIRETDEKGRDGVIFAQSGYFDLHDNQRTLVLENGYRYKGTAGRGDFERISFDSLRLLINITPKIIQPIEHRRTLPTQALWGNPDPKHQAELMWRISLPIALLLLALLAIPLSYFNPRSGTSYHVLLAIGFFLFYQNGLTLLRDAVEDGKINFWLGFLPMHVVIVLCAWALLSIRSMPAKPFVSALRDVLSRGNR